MLKDAIWGSPGVTYHMSQVLVGFLERVTGGEHEDKEHGGWGWGGGALEV